MDRKMVDFIKEQYPPGTRIRLNSMEDPYHPILPGTEGEVDYVDDAGQLHMKWDNSRSLALFPGEDSFTAVTREVREETGLDISAVPAVMRTPIYGYRNEDLKRGDNYFVDIYHVKLEFAEADVTIEQSEAIDFRMATMDEIRALHEADEFLHYKRIQEALAAEKKVTQA